MCSGLSPAETANSLILISFQVETNNPTSSGHADKTIMLDAVPGGPGRLELGNMREIIAEGHGRGPVIAGPERLLAAGHRMHSGHSFIVLSRPRDHMNPVYSAPTQMRGSPLPLLSSVQLFSDDTAKDLFEGLLLTFNICSECIIEHRLVVAPALFFHLGTGNQSIL